MNKDPRNGGWLVWSCSPLATKISVFVTKFSPPTRNQEVVVGLGDQTWFGLSRRRSIDFLR